MSDSVQPDTTSSDDSQRCVTVCSACLRASCWRGLFYCDKAQDAGTTWRTVAELRALGREHPDYYAADQANYPEPEVVDCESVWTDEVGP